MANIKRLHAIVTGNVQGVGFRYFVQKTALNLGLTGWVRNLSNGDVELEAEGEAAILESFLETVRTGHRWAHVSNIEATRFPDNKSYSDFEISD
jgi:acylphosphatase